MARNGSRSRGSANPTMSSLGYVAGRARASAFAKTAALHGLRDLNPPHATGESLPFSRGQASHKFAIQSESLS